MNADEIAASSPAQPTSHAGRVSISKWVNEKLPPWNQLLTAHDVARLIRRHRLVLSGLMLLGQFPPRRRFRGRKVGWHQSDVERWLTMRGPCSIRRRPQIEVRSAMSAMRCARRWRCRR